MRSFWKWVFGILAATVASSLVVFFEPDIQRLRSDQDLDVDLYVGPWMAFPVTEKIAASNDQITLETQRQFAAKSIRSLGRLDVTNAGSETVRDIRLDIGEGGRLWVVMMTAELSDASDLGLPRFVEMPDLKPGEQATIFMLSAHDVAYTFQRGPARVTSSQGRAPIDVHWFEDEVTGVESLGDWILLLPATSFIILLGLLLYGAAATGIYYTRLLESEDFYLAEKIRFDADRKHFVPSTGAKPRSGGEAAA